MALPNTTIWPEKAYPYTSLQPLLLLPPVSQSRTTAPMQPSAHIAATTEILAELFTQWHQGKPLPADITLDRYFRKRRYMGSKDRGAVAELFYWILRNLAALDWWCRQSGLGYHSPLPYPPTTEDNAQTARLLVMAALLFSGRSTRSHLATLFDGGKYGAPLLTDGEWGYVGRIVDESLIQADMPDWVRLNFPEWLEPQLVEAFGDELEGMMEALRKEAPVDLRVNTLKTTRAALMQLLQDEGFLATPTTLSPVGIRLARRGPIFATELFRQGMLEMQDEGSQVAALIVDAQPGQRVIDFCAGAGGKTLAIAAAMQNKGRILAFDTSAKRLSELPPRLRRAGVDTVEWKTLTSEHDAVLKRHKNTADRVLVDAPCSGVGTWRRNPDLKWRTTQQDLDELCALQQSILASASRLVKVGGRLIYVTCSLLKRENEKQVDTFLQTHPNFRVVCAKKIWDKNDTRQAGKPSYLWLSPKDNGTDGFFAAVLERV